MGLTFDTLRETGYTVLVDTATYFIMRVGYWKEFVKDLSKQGVKFTQLKDYFDVDILVNVFWMDDLWGVDDYKNVSEWLDEIKIAFDLDKNDERFNHIIQHYEEEKERGN